MFSHERCISGAREGTGTQIGTFRPVYILRLRQIDIADLAIQKDNSCGRLLVGGGCCMPLRGEIGKEAPSPRAPIARGCRGRAEANTAPNPRRRMPLGL